MARKPGDVVGEQVRYFRRKHGWTQEQLVRRLEDLGIHGWRQSKVAKIERGEARRLPVDDVLELALALGCPPVMLLAPEGPEGASLEPPPLVEIAPGHAVPARRVRDWIRGRDPLIRSDVSDEEKRAAAVFYFLESQPWQDWAIGDDDFRLSGAVKQANEAREALLEEQMEQFEKNVS